MRTAALLSIPVLLIGFTADAAPAKLANPVVEIVIRHDSKPFKRSAKALTKLLKRTRNVGVADGSSKAYELARCGPDETCVAVNAEDAGEMWILVLAPPDDEGDENVTPPG